MALILLLTWGTVITLPLHEFTDLLAGFVSKGVMRISEATPTAVVTILQLISFTVVEIILLLLSKTRFALYIPTVATVITTIHFVVNIAIWRYFDSTKGIALGITLALLAVLHVTKAEKILIWLCDFYIYSLSIFLATGLIFIPLANRFPKLAPILYIKNYQSYDLGASFSGFLTLPAIVWGAFFMVLLSLPVIYYTFSRRKA
ncbi:MAG: hypothetical protein MJ094_02010 [Saccharofermentans sp.]|nr:hypothetical protein [Saccharofermentans sp.]